MSKIQVLDQITIDKIAAGEVIERPASVVKELVENAIDARASAVTVEIQEGGIAMIRITDNGIGIAKEDVSNAFLRHSTSKIRTLDDLMCIGSLGFRGEALSSIAAVSQVEMTTKQSEDTFGTRYVIEGGVEKSNDDAGAPDGTTFLIRQLFYNIPARRKFLKTAMTEASHVHDLLMRLALSHPEVAFRFISNGQEKLRTSGNGKVKDVIYSIYGRDVASNLIEVHFEKNGMKMTGYLGKPLISRGNRNFENYFINGRYIRSGMISKAIEDGYKDFMMQHKFPFVVLYFTLPADEIDINVHPTKMDIRFHRQQDLYHFVYEGVHRFLMEPELIPEVEIPEPKTVPLILAKTEQKTAPSTAEKPEAKTAPQIAEKPQNSRVFDKENVNKNVENVDNFDEDYFLKKMKERVTSYHQKNSSAEVKSGTVFKPEVQRDRIKEASTYRYQDENPSKSTIFEGEKTEHAPQKPIQIEEKTERALENKPEQLNFFDEKLLNKEKKAEYQIVGQVFDTYWLVQFQDNLYIIDQHAAHERVLYERTLREMKNREFTSQMISPPIVLSLTMQEADLMTTHLDRFLRLGFEIEPFGGNEYAVRAVPDNLFSIAKKDLLLEMLDQLEDGISTGMTPDLIDEKIASMSCKAAVKGNQKLSVQEVNALIGELLELENPYHCPHGRPTIISMSKRDLEKKFKRIL